MTDQCPYLEYRELSEVTGATEAAGTTEATGTDLRAYCTAAQLFVQPMRADICNLRYGLDPETDCEFYRDAEGLPEAPGGDTEVPGGDTETGDTTGEVREATDEDRNATNRADDEPGGESE